MDAKAQEILDFWFGDTTGFRQEWFRKDPTYDAKIRAQFGEDLERAIQGEYDDWAETPQGRLALIILLDQFSRNLFRGSPKSWSQDPKSLDLTLKGIDAGHDKKLTLNQRFFFYLPLQHAEDPDMQDLSIAQYKGLSEEYPDPDSIAHNGLDYAHRHQVIIERFGRYPHRNEIMGRESTPEEVEFLKGPNSSF